MIEDAIVRHGLPLAALLVFASSLGIPTGVPIKVVLIAVGSLVVTSEAELPLAFAVLVGAEMAGTMSLHTIARVAGSRIPSRLANTQNAARGALDRWRVKLGGRDAVAIFILRLVPVVRIGITIGAGALGVRTRDFVIGAFPAAMIWIGLPLGLGWIFRDSVHELESYIDRTMGPLIGTVAVVAAAVLLVWWKRRRTAAAAAAVGDGVVG